MNHSLTTVSFIRYAVAFVFITSGMMKLFSTELLEVFIGLGLPFPDILLYVTAFLEIICGILILLNRSVKNAVIPLIGIMIAAILLTKLPLITGGILPFAFKARLDIVMLILLYILYSKSPS
ncbi:DoxX family protein [Neobacillus sp. YX16]|uniref:DoxX family protein n=1 Tax=Neobacillus sp. YX16 TaxID=3047874 RepID=UPI0024C2C633|nr:DoxX family protein [Neobacillus sp. YX16]WHZ04242.1 DoxX family protein [Neobacillus sp. YX16]